MSNVSDFDSFESLFDFLDELFFVTGIRLVWDEGTDKVRYFISKQSKEWRRYNRYMYQGKWVDNQRDVYFSHREAIERLLSLPQVSMMLREK